MRITDFDADNQFVKREKRRVEKLELQPLFPKGVLSNEEVTDRVRRKSKSGATRRFVLRNKQ